MPHDHRQRIRIILAGLSLLLWLLSLGLPGFYASGEDRVWLGLTIVLMGIPFGWMAESIGGYAVYANLFYVYVLVQTGRGKAVKLSVIAMLGLASLTVGFDRFMVSALPSYATVWSWGWGAVLWGMALLLLACAAWLPEEAGRRKVVVRMAGGVGLAVIAGLAGLKAWQYRAANADERERYLPPLSAFSVAPFSGLPYRLPPPLAIGKETVFALQGVLDGQLHLSPDGAAAGYRIRQLPRSFQYGGFFWQYLAALPGFKLYLLQAERAADYRYGLVSRADHAEHVLTDARSGEMLWQAPVRMDGASGIYPDYDMDAWFNREEQGGAESALLPAQDFDESCPHAPFDAPDGIGNAIRWQGRILNMVNDEGYGNSFAADYPLAFCSPHYALLIGHPVHAHGELRVQAMLFERASLRFLGEFQSFAGRGSADPATVEQYRRLTDEGRQAPSVDWAHIRLDRQSVAPRRGGQAQLRNVLRLRTDRGDWEVPAARF